MPSGAPTSAAEGRPAADPLAVDAGGPAGAGPPPALAIASSASSTVTYLGDNLCHTESELHQRMNDAYHIHLAADAHTAAMCILLKKRIKTWQSDFDASVQSEI